MEHKISKSLRIYATLIIFLILSSSMLATGTIGLFMYHNGMLRSTFARPFTIILWIYCISLIISTAITWLIGKWVLSPISKISSASARIAKGDFSIRLREDSKIEEVQTTFQNFNNMVKELNAIEMLRSDFIANVSHEFKTPLNAIEGYATLLQEADISDSDRKEYLEKILFNTSRLSVLAGNILTLSKLENQNIPEEKNPYQLDEQLRQCLVLLEPKWSAKNIELDIELDEVRITSCENLMAQVWMNLIGNAIKFSRDGGKITIRLTQTRDGALVSIRDEGCGMNGGTMKHIFEKFYQGDTSHKAEGNGLGLAMVKKILDLCDGFISVSSAEGEGSTFKVILPNEPQQ